MINAVEAGRRREGISHLHNLRLFFEIRMKVCVALIHQKILARRSSPITAVEGVEGDMT